MGPDFAEFRLEENGDIYRKEIAMSDQSHRPEESKDRPANIEEGELVEIVDIEVFGKQNCKPPRAKTYRLRIDREYFTVEKQFITGLELLQLVHKLPSAWRIHQKLHGGLMREISPDEVVDLGQPGLERFVTMELTQGDGEQATANEVESAKIEPSARRHFLLSKEDEAYLNSLLLRWETIKDGPVQWLLIHNHALPTGYKQPTATLAIRIEGGYPPGALDMAYFLPLLERTDSKGINAVATQSIDGKMYQRWSRHYAWRDGIDSVATHHLRIKQWLDSEPKR